MPLAMMADLSLRAKRSNLTESKKIAKRLLRSAVAGLAMTESKPLVMME